MQKKAFEDLKIACRTEIVGYNFYITASDIIKDNHGQTVFRHLSEDELSHLRVLSAISRSLETGGGWLSYEKAIEAGSSGKGAPIFIEGNELIERLNKNPTEVNAITIAMEAEEKAVDFYSGMLKTAKGHDEKGVLEKILHMEKNHLKLLRWERESIIHTGFWADFMEFSVEKELE